MLRHVGSFAASAVASVLAAALTVGCAEESNVADEAVTACVDVCRDHLEIYHTDLSDGPCLSKTLPGGVITPDFVCDVAHAPRAAIDDNPVNQCQAFIDGTARHLVEVDLQCTAIRVD